MPYGLRDYAIVRDIIKMLNLDIESTGKNYCQQYR